MLAVIREQLGLGELPGLQDSVVLELETHKPLPGQLTEMATQHRWLNLQRVGVG